MTIDTVPGDVLLYVFDFYLAEASEVEAWNTLVHVCQRWRIVVFRSPRRLNLRITYTNYTPIEKLDVWPSLPIAITRYSYWDLDKSLDNMIALGHHHRVCQIELSFRWEFFERVMEYLGCSFPKVTVLKLNSNDSPSTDPFLPTSGQHLRGTCHLQSLSLTSIPILGLRNLLLSSINLVDLRLKDLPTSIFISPDKMVTVLFALTKLQVLHLGPKFDDDDLHPDWENRRSLLPTRTVLSSLIELKFEGAIEYLEDFMARIDSPLLDRLDVVVFFPWDQVIAPDTHTPQLLQFISRVPKLRVLTEAHIGIDNSDSDAQAWINFLSMRTSSGVLKLGIRCNEPKQQFSFLARFFRSPFFPLPTLENLYIDGGRYSRHFVRNDMENAGWLELLQPFTSVKNLYLSMVFAVRLVSTLKDLRGEIVREVLPTLENIFIRKLRSHGPLIEAFWNFAAMRQLSSGCPIVVSDWKRTRREAALMCM